jgi:hypothetical protein
VRHETSNNPGFGEDSRQIEGWGEMDIGDG